VNEGEFLINDIIVNEKILARFRSKVSYIPQQVYLMDTSIVTNITFKEKIDSDDNKFYESIKKAKLDKFIDSLPNGINTHIGERGIRISGGQRQRLALARAFYSDKEIIFLDESTSELDSDTEKDILSDLFTISSDLTLILISHKKDTLKLCDKVIYLKDNNILETL